MESQNYIYIQIMGEIRKRILNGYYAPGTPIPSTRKLAEEFKINPNTMQKALAQLKKEKLLVKQSSVRRCVSEDTVLLEQVKNDILINLKCKYEKEVASYIYKAKNNDKEYFED